MKKIYAVVSGEYSDFGIDALFDNKELANNYIKAFDQEGAWSAMRIVEYPLNPYERQLKENRKAYFVRMDKEGNVLDISIDNCSYGFHGEDEDPFDRYCNLILHVFARDKAHAIKIVNEKRVQYIANNKWKKLEK